MSGRGFLMLAFVLAGLAGPALAYKQLAPPEKVELPKPLSPEQSLAAIQVPDDLVVELVAAEPLVMDPVDVAWGADGRMWVVEMADYPSGIEGKPGGRVRVLESTRGDGRYDKMTLFADGLRYPTSVLPWRHGVLVVAVPDILLLEDTDGDGRADKRTVLFTGLGVGNPQHLANGFQWDLDGWLQMANGNSGGKVTSPQSPVALDLGQRDFRIRVETGAVEIVAGQTQCGRNRDDWGNWFGSNNSNPLWHFALEERYLRRNPHLVPPGAAVSVPKFPGAAPVFPRSKTLARFNDPHGFNHFTSACGSMIYRDEVLGAGYAGNAFVCEPVHNLVHREVLRPAGATFTGDRAPGDEAGEFLVSTDHWSRFAAVRAGPDGALYVVDMYRHVIEHPEWIPAAWQKQLGDLRAGETMGRIYRVRPRNGVLRAIPRLDRANAAGLVAALESPSGLIRDLAQQQLGWRGDKSQTAEMERLAATSARAATRVQALWTLQTTGALSPAVVAKALRDPVPAVRRQAVRLSEAWADRAPGLLAAVAALADDTDAAVRHQVAYTLGEWKSSEAGEALVRLLRATDDRFIRTAAMSSALPHAEVLLTRLAGAGGEADPLVIEIAAATENAQALASILGRIAESAGETGGRFEALGLLLDWLQRHRKTLSQLKSATTDPALARALKATDGVFEVARGVVVDVRVPLAQRVRAVNVLGRGREKVAEDVDLLAGLLAPQSPTELQLAAIASLARINRPAVPERLLAAWAGYSGAVRSAVLDAVMSRPTWAQALLDRVEANRDLVNQIDAARRTALMQHSNAGLADRATKLFSAALDANRQRVVERYLSAVETRKGEAVKGRAVFEAVCSACHRFGAVEGRPIGPDLAAVKDRSPGYLIAHILDPNRAVEERYVLYTATMVDGRTLSGMVTSEAGTSLTLLGLDGREQPILRSELRTLMSTTRSLMPDGLEGAIDEQAMADLAAFLAGGEAGLK
ncbi:MAG: HEAT repeat domain-containing protein [Verrucomicrobia bacterium]|nr:HEAT repeat domain-containing protein [Verrucomicrobiota bacterium]